MRNPNRNEILGYISECKQAYIIRVGNELLIDNDITETSDANRKSKLKFEILNDKKVYKQKYFSLS